MGAADRTIPSSLILKKIKLLLRPKAAHNTTSQLQSQIKRKKNKKKLKYTKIRHYKM